MGELIMEARQPLSWKIDRTDPSTLPFRAFDRTSSLAGDRDLGGCIGTRASVRGFQTAGSCCSSVVFADARGVPTSIAGRIAGRSSLALAALSLAAALSFSTGRFLTMRR
jgi:hypothetical protein